MPGPYDFLDPQSPLPPPEPPIQQMAQARTKRIFGVPITPRRGRTFAAGLAQGLQGIQAGGGFNNFLQGFSGGLGGALRGGEVFDESQRRTHEDERQQVAQANQNRELQLAEERTRLAQNEDTRQWGEYNAKMNPTPTPDKGLQFGTPPWYVNPNLPPELQGVAKQFVNKETTLPDHDSSAPTMDNATLNMAAQVYLKTGQMPALGMSKQGAYYRTEILNRAAHMPAEGFPAGTPDVAGNTAGFKADQKSLAKLVDTRNSLEAFSQTAIANSKVLLETAKSIPDWNNRFLNAANRRAAAIFGDPSIAQFNTSLETVLPEFARILESGGSITGQSLTVQQKKDMRAVLHGDFTYRQLESSLNILNREVENRKTSYDNQIDELKARIGQSPGGGGSAPQATDADRAYIQSLGIK